MKKVTSRLPLHFSFISALFCCALIMVMFTELAAAQTWYIRPTAEIPLRRGQGSDYKILAIVPNGTAVDVIKEEGSWTNVVTKDGQEGWILGRYLTTEPPLEESLEALQKENAIYKEKSVVLQSRNEELKALNTALQNTLENNKNQLVETTAKYRKLTDDTADVIAIRNNLDQSRQTITKLQQELDSITAENKRLKASQNIKWFLAGVGTLIFGGIVGMAGSKSKKRRSSLY
ncbi:TIGR04211 family SH3 domain-containing protein [Desulfopila inferna]|uniref:TIGR04211 family SH3 domain-containing protein n=1 Tax=Desulfopila inferna TaxID=468528 RepID=UPI00196501E6|nr:TIGR04211 family SH3 domain-containing protein [Desulfopila inferna]MBM9603294.1 TIGR04211 family SH3 domain-containing protein [Desulfopila inferna]